MSRMLLKGVICPECCQIVIHLLCKNNNPYPRSCAFL